MKYRTANGQALKIGEVPYQFRERHAGTSKMSPLVVVQFLGLLVSKMTGGLLPTSFLLFALVGRHRPRRAPRHADGGQRDCCTRHSGSARRSPRSSR